MSTTKTLRVSITSDDATHEVDSLRALDAVLDSIHEAGKPTWIEIVVDDDPTAGPDEIGGLHIGLGADYSTLAFYDTKPPYRRDSVGTLPMPANVEEFLVSGSPTAMEPDSAITVDAAREAAREFARTGKLPGCVKWRTAE